jgi:DNA repair protein RecN (Recombination protein N)
MLQTLRIRNLVIVEDLTLEFGPGLNLLTGETGAGKSILVDALGLLSGARADRAAVREGERRAVVEALFDVSGHAGLGALLAERGLDEPENDQLLVHREVAASGAGRILINGSPATLPLLRELGERLLELCGQHEQQALLRPERHLELLDRYGEHGGLVAEVGRHCRAVHEARARAAALGHDAAHRGERLAELERTRREIEALALRPGELAELDRERRILQSAERIAELLDAVVERTYEGEPNAAALAAAAASRAEELAAIDPRLEELARRCRGAAIELADVGAGFRDWRERADFDPLRLDGIEARRAAIERACLRHGRDEAGLAALREEAVAELARLAGLESELAHAASEVVAAERAYEAIAVELGGARARAADALGAAVQSQLAEVALCDASLTVELSPARGESIAGASGPLALGLRGAERAELQFTANPGQPPRPLALVASGGELSRVLLALHVAADDGGDPRSIVFDEVDAGVSGRVADALGARLARVAARRQVLCVTHLPQVAAYADTHFRVAKHVAGGRTWATAEPLGEIERIEELARMLGGRVVNATSREHAAALLRAARRSGVRETATRRGA